MTLFSRLFPSVYSLTETHDTGAAVAIRELLGDFVSPAVAEPPSASATGSPDDDQLLSALCTGIWKLRRRLSDPATARGKPEFRREYSYVREMSKALEDARVEIIDYTGEPYDSGLAMEVLAFEPGTSGAETIKETLRPAVVRNNKRLQVPQVIVGSATAHTSADPIDD